MIKKNNKTKISNRQKRLKIAIFIDHDIVIRHFIHSGAFLKLAEKHKVDFVLPPLGHRRVTLNPSKYIGNAKIIRLKENIKSRRIWARMEQVLIMKPSFKKRDKDLRKTWRLVMNWKAEILNTFLGMPIIFNLFSIFTRWNSKKNPNIALFNLLKKNNYDVIINPGIPGGLFINDLFINSKKLNIPLIFIMNSWDNPSAGKFASGKPNFYLAWGTQTSRHAHEYLNISKSRIRSFGAAQFEIYRSKPKIDKNTFLKNHNIKPNTKIILYAGGSLGTNEFEHLKLIEKEIEKGKYGDTIIIYRPHPWGGGGNRGDEIFNHSWNYVRIENSMRSYLESISKEGYKLSFPDYSDTHVVLTYVDFVISPLSTILIEAAIHGKPIICFLPMEDIQAKHFQTVYSLPHFREFQNEKEVILASNRKELIQKINLLFDKFKDVSFSKKLKKMSQKYVENHKLEFSKRIINFVEEIKENL